MQGSRHHACCWCYRAAAGPTQPRLQPQLRPPPQPASALAPTGKPGCGLALFQTEPDWHARRRISKSATFAGLFKIGRPAEAIRVACVAFRNIWQGATDANVQFHNVFWHTALRILVTVAKYDALIDADVQFYNVFAHTALRILVTVAKSDEVSPWNLRQLHRFRRSHAKTHYV